jgi:hypothetical protein
MGVISASGKNRGKVEAKTAGKCEGEAAAEGETKAEAEGKAAGMGEGAAAAEGETKAKAEGNGEAQARGEGAGKVEGEGGMTKPPFVDSSVATVFDDTSAQFDDSSETPSYTSEGVRKSSRAEGQWFGLFLAVARGQRQAANDNVGSDQVNT